MPERLIINPITPEDELQKLGQELGQLADLVNKGAYREITDTSFSLLSRRDPDYLILCKILAVQEGRVRLQVALTQYLDVRKNMGLSFETELNCLRHKLERKIEGLNNVEEELIESLPED